MPFPRSEVMTIPAVRYYADTSSSGAVEVGEEDAARLILEERRPILVVTRGHGRQFTVVVALDAHGLPAAVPRFGDEPIGSEKSRTIAGLMLRVGDFLDELVEKLE